MPLPLAARLLRIGVVALTVLAVDWALKAWALGAVPVVFNTDRPWEAVVICGVLAIGLSPPPARRCWPSAPA